MSVTTTENPGTYSIIRTLADYDLHHSETDPSAPVDTQLNAHPAPEVAEESAPGWETEYRRVPPYMPANRELDFNLRNQYNNNPEWFFITNMFGGIAWVERLNKAWRATGGKVNNTYFRWQVGGEF